MRNVYAEPYLYLKIEEENLRSSPNGKKIGTVLQKTKFKKLGEKGKWVKVQLTGWIWKPSLTDDLAKIEEKRSDIETIDFEGIYTSEGNFKILGKVRNNSKFVLSQIKIKFSLHKGKKIIASKEGYAPQKEYRLQAGQIAQFSVEFPNPPDFDEYSTQVVDWKVEALK